jgi:Fic family protein
MCYYFCMKTFAPHFSITPALATALLRIEAARERIIHLPLSPRVIASLRESARLRTTHYSTMIEGNRLTQEQVAEVVHLEGHFPGRERDEEEVRGYYAALAYVESLVAQRKPITERIVQTIHALVMASGRSRVKPTPYRDGQNVIRDSRTRRIVYLPPEARDVPTLMKSLVAWIAATSDLPAPLVAGIVHYQIATIHPYYDGNGRISRLATTFVLHQRGYDLKGLYSLEEYYARDLSRYYEALTVGPSHNYYEGRAEADITAWLAYFSEGMAEACERIFEQMNRTENRAAVQQEHLLYELNPQQRATLALFADVQHVITASQIAKLFHFAPRTAAALCQRWIANGFLTLANPSKKARSYRLHSHYHPLLRSA